MTLTLISPAFADGEPIPVKYTRLGENLMPPLKWSGPPEQTKSYVLIVEDPDAPNGTFRHCGAFNIPANWNELSQSADTAPDGGPSFSQNDFGNARYDGPQPPKGHGLHHYHFRLRCAFCLRHRHAEPRGRDCACGERGTWCRGRYCVRSRRDLHATNRGLRLPCVRSTSVRHAVLAWRPLPSARCTDR
ncbi:YbhB/YbcL family Raf kinase inhibitor-like protein [Neorhizobium petrolearium]